MVREASHIQPPSAVHALVRPAITTPRKATMAIGHVSWKFAWARARRPSSRSSGLEVNRGEDVNEEQERSQGGDLELDRHENLPFDERLIQLPANRLGCEASLTAVKVAGPNFTYSSLISSGGCHVPPRFS